MEIGADAALISGLWTSHARGKKLRANLSETLLLKSDGSVDRWLFTSAQSGKICRKHACSIEDIVKEFGRNETGEFPVSTKCIAFMRNGQRKRILIETLGSEFDFSSTLALQVPQRPIHELGALFRCSVKITSTTRRFEVYSSQLSWNIDDCLQIGDPVRCRTPNLRDVLIKVTSELIAFWEKYTFKERKPKVFAAEFLLDAKNEPWLTWCSAIEALQLEPALLSPGQGPSKRNRRKRKFLSPRKSEEEVSALGAQIVQASKEIEQGETSFVAEAMKEDPEEKRFLAKNFPNPFNCKGDFCEFKIHDPDASVVRDAGNSKQQMLLLAQSLFTKGEMEKMAIKLGFDVNTPEGKAKAILKLAETFGSSHFEKASRSRQHYAKAEDVGRCYVSMRSVALARKENPSHAKKTKKTPKYQQPKRRGDIGPDECDWQLAEHGKIPLGHFYQDVAVCERCFQIYCTLDKAREILKENSSESKEMQRVSSDLIERLSRKRNKSKTRTRTPSPIRCAGAFMREIPELLPEKPISISKREAKAQEMLKIENKTAGMLKANAIRIGTRSISTRKDAKALADQHAGSLKTFHDLDSFLRGKRPVKFSGEDEEYILSKLNRHKVLVIESDQNACEELRQIFVENKRKFNVIFHNEPNTASAAEFALQGDFDLVLLSMESGIDGIEFAKSIREREATDESQDIRETISLVAVSRQTSPKVLHSMMDAGYDSCVSKPISAKSLLNTLQALLNIGKKSERGKRENEVTPQSNGPRMRSSTEVVALGLPQKRKVSADGVKSSRGVFQMNAFTAVPYQVLGTKQKDSHVFNFVVVNDFFDTYEMMELCFKPIVAKFPGMQVLLFNLPGQAFTEWRSETALNNAFYDMCLEELLKHVNCNGTGEFDTSGPYASPFFLLGRGNGSNIAMRHAMRCKPRFLRGVVSINGFSHVDPHLAGVLHDCMNVFSCAPPTRPDLPVYFYARFLFSQTYLAKVTTPLALNLYTAVHNPISLKGRLQICKGALAHEDLRTMMQDSDVPLILVQSSEDTLVKPVHAEYCVRAKGGEARSIRECLQEREEPVVLWFRTGHEIIQECRKPIIELLEQLASGYHEKHEIVATIEGSKRVRSPGKRKRRSEVFEDRFISNVLATRKTTLAASSHSRDGDVELEREAEEARWEKFREETERLAKLRLDDHGKIPQQQRVKKFPLSPTNDEVFEKMYDPNAREFDWAQHKKAHDPRLRVAVGGTVHPKDLPEVKEYMQWRLARNKKRLRKIVDAVSVLQRAWRAFLARTLVHKLRCEKAALVLQSKWRQKLAQNEVDYRRQELWACRLVQRCWRGRLGRVEFNEKRDQTSAALHMQRIFRGKKGKHRVNQIKHYRQFAAQRIQNLIRRSVARSEAGKRRKVRNAATTIEKVWRGYKGRVEAHLERDKYLFSKSQTQGIEFGRQMLMEHKLHGTRLQSEVSLLNQEKAETEAKLDALLGEIAEFDKGVRALEREMHELNAVESDAHGALDVEARLELREQKMRLDQEFGIMLEKIADRKDKLKTLEDKLQSIDRTRHSKEEELRDLERKLVILLEEQQQELEEIKQRQKARGELLLPESVASSFVNLSQGVSSGGYRGPTPQEKQEAENMIQSTESLMKFGFMSMSLTYFSSLNMMRAMRRVGAINTVLHGDPYSSQPIQEQQDHKIDEASNNNPVRVIEMEGSVTAWTVEDVGDWLETLKLGQYRVSFGDAAVDGAFLFDLNDEDLRNTLNIEHNLHRKKILNSVAKLRQIEEKNNEQLLGHSALSQGSIMSISATQAKPLVNALESDTKADGKKEDFVSPAAALTVVPDKLFSMVRHGKYKQLQEAFENLPDRPFDPIDVQHQFVAGIGTEYTEERRRLAWWINKIDDFGNTLLHIAAQNGKERIAKLLIKKGANPNHQNNQGQTALHYAMAYNFYELGAWLADPQDGAGANDQLLNMYDLNPYDGLSPEQ